MSMVRVFALLLCGSVIATGATSLASDDYALRFDGVNDYVYVPHNAILDPADQITIELWIKCFVGGTITPRVLAKSYSVHTRTTGSKRQIVMQLPPGAAISPDSISCDEWHHIAGTYDGSWVRLYIDGLAVDSAASTGPLTTNTEHLRIGQFNHWAWDAFSGLVDEVRIWNYSRSATEIAQNMYRSADTSDPGLVAYWNFNEGSGQVLSDLSGYGNDGRLGSTTGPDNADPIWDSGGVLACPTDQTGDVNLDGGIMAGDIIYLVNYVFKSGPAPLPCPAAGDVNCDGVVTSADIVYLLGHVFKGGPPPCDVCTIIPSAWTCP